MEFKKVSLKIVLSLVLGSFFLGILLTSSKVSSDSVYDTRTGIGLSENLKKQFSSDNSPLILVSSVFTPRLSEPARINAYYFSNNVFEQSFYGMPNCTA